MVDEARRVGALYYKGVGGLRGGEAGGGCPLPCESEHGCGGWRVVGGRVVRKVEVVSRLGSPVGRARTAGLTGIKEKVQALVRSGSLGWGVSAKV